MKISNTDFLKNYHALTDKAQSEPIVITEGGRDRLVVLSAEEYERLKRRDRRVVKLEDFTEEEMALIARSEPSREDAHLDAELKDWRP
jgi:PHD/YefM family antitoxin component YafN of YafNO toxin-antitoxin module